jgi:hypothetical protein
MKKIIFMLFMISIAHLTFAQPKAVKQFYNKYKHLEGVEDFKLGGFMLRLASGFSDDEDAEKWLKKITNLRIMTIENGNPVSAQDYNDLIKNIKKEAFEDLMMVKEDGKKVQFLMREKDDKITDLLLLVSGDEEFTLLSLEGLLKFSDLNDLNIEIDGHKEFHRLPEDRKGVQKM